MIVLLTYLTFSLNSLAKILGLVNEGWTVQSNPITYMLYIPLHTLLFEGSDILKRLFGTRFYDAVRRQGLPLLDNVDLPKASKSGKFNPKGSATYYAQLCYPYWCLLVSETSYVYSSILCILIISIYKLHMISE